MLIIINKILEKCNAWMKLYDFALVKFNPIKFDFRFYNG